MFELFLKIFASPEDILGIVFEILHIISICFVCVEFKEVWWKGLIPIYNVYLLYKHSWKYKWFFIFEYLFLILQSRSLKLIKTEVIVNIFDLVKDIYNKQEIGIDFDFRLVLICLFLMFIFGLFVFIMRRITYFKISKKFNYNSIQIICVLISPIFFFFFIIWKKYKNRNIYS